MGCMLQTGIKINKKRRNAQIPIPDAVQVNNVQIGDTKMHGLAFGCLRVLTFSGKGREEGLVLAVA